MHEDVEVDVVLVIQLFKRVFKWFLNIVQENMMKKKNVKHVTWGGKKDHIGPSWKFSLGIVHDLSSDKMIEMALKSIFGFLWM